MSKVIQTVEELRAMLDAKTEAVAGHHPACRAVDDYKPGKCSHSCKPAAQPQGVPSEVVAFGIQVKKLLCDALGREWSASGISIESLVAELKGWPWGEPVAWLGSSVPFLTREDAIEYASYKDKKVIALYAEKPAPVAGAYQYRQRPLWRKDDKSGWMPWQECSQGVHADYTATPELNDWQYETRTLYVGPNQQ